MMDVKKTTVAASPDHCYDGPGDVACDFCTRRKQKAVKTCLQCRVSYCDAHLLLHYRSPALQAHRLVKASGELWENICSRHDEVRKLFCRTDQQCICSLCSMEEHKGHDIISAAAERAERQKRFDMSQQNLQQRIQEREKDAKVLHEEIKNINHSADRAVEYADTVFNKLTTSTKRRRSEVRELIRDQQKREASHAEEQRKCVEQEVTELEGRHAELEQISHIEDDIHFLHRYISLSRISEATHPVSSNVRPQRSFEDVTVAVSKIRDELEDSLREAGTNVSEGVKRVDVLLSRPPEKKQLEDVLKIKKMKRAFVVILFFVITLTHSLRSSVQPQSTHGERFLGHHNTTPGWLEPKTREEFLQYKVPITLDPNTANYYLSLSKGNRKVTMMTEKQSYPHHPERFTTMQVLSIEGLTGRCYWEAEWSGNLVDIAVSHKDISRTGSQYEVVNGFRFDLSIFAFSDIALSLRCWPGGYSFNHNKSLYMIPGPVSSRVGVYLDHSAGTLSFYRVSDTMTLLHRVQATFTQPLYAGFGFWAGEGDSAELCDFE